MEKEKLKDYAHKLMFDMKEEEYDTLQEEFDVILKQMNFIGNIKDIRSVEPMSYPFITYENELREDEVGDYLTVNEVLSNTKYQVDDQVKVPKVVE